MIKAYASNAAGQVGMGYAVGYPFGVIVVILAVNFLNVIFRFNVEEEKRKYALEMAQAKKDIKVKRNPNHTVQYPFFCHCMFRRIFVGKSERLHGSSRVCQPGIHRRRPHVPPWRWDTSVKSVPFLQNGPQNPGHGQRIRPGFLSGYCRTQLRIRRDYGFGRRGSDPCNCVYHCRSAGNPGRIPPGPLRI